MRSTSLIFLALLALTACKPGDAQDRSDANNNETVTAPAPPADINAVEDAPAPVITDTAAPVPSTTAPALLAEGKPVNPLCFAPYLLGETKPGTIALSGHCAPGYSATMKDYLPIEGYTGTGYTMDSDPDAQGMRPAFIAYRVIGNTADDKVALQLMGSGGGTGIFTTLLTATRTGDTLKIEDTVAGGDRCNGGITEASMTKDGKLAYAVNITPYDFLTLGGAGDPPTLKAYDDIDACAACCLGKALYEGGAFAGVRLNAPFTASEQPPEKTAQICFDKIMAAQKDTKWTPETYAPLRDRLVKECSP